MPTIATTTTRQSSTSKTLPITFFTFTVILLTALFCRTIITHSPRRLEEYTLGCILSTPDAPGQRAFSRRAASFFLEIRQYSCGKMSCSAQKFLAAGHIMSFQIHPRKHRTIVSTRFDGSFLPLLRFEKFEICRSRWRRRRLTDAGTYRIPAHFKP